MSSRIYKYVVDHLIKMPKGAEVLSLGLDPQLQVCLWARVNPEAAQVARVVRAYGTGVDLHDFTGKFITTLVVGPNVWHFFDCGEVAIDNAVPLTKTLP